MSTHFWTCSPCTCYIYYGFKHGLLSILISCLSLSFSNSSSGLSLPPFNHTSFTSASSLLASSVPFSLSFVLILSLLTLYPLPLPQNLSRLIKHLLISSNSSTLPRPLSLMLNQFPRQHSRYIIRNVMPWVPSLTNYSSISLWICIYTLLFMLFAWNTSTLKCTQLCIFWTCTAMFKSSLLSFVFESHYVWF